MKPVTTYIVTATLPAALASLKELSYNYWWCWYLDAMQLFERMDRELWEEVRHNPVELLNRIEPKRLDALAAQEDFVRDVNVVIDRLHTYLSEQKWFDGQNNHSAGKKIAYFSLEFGINESFPNYSGGLGILAGDHLKSASDLGVPLIAVGLLYQMGYFHQYLTQSGWQKESYLTNDFYSLPLTLVRDETGARIMIGVRLPAGMVYAQVWKMLVGKTHLYLLDTNIPENEGIPEYRDIADQLYGGTTDTRIQQEILLGIGGIRALRAMGINPTVIHINEGHAAFASLERTRLHMEDKGLDFATAYELTHSGMIFTTHTPVPAGNEVFSADLIDRYFGAYWGMLGLSRDDFFALGNISMPSNSFSMTVLALKMSSFRNGVSQLHGKVARAMWRDLWKDFPNEEVPIGAITNGIHTQTWVAGGLAELYDKYLTPRWRTETDDETVWQLAQTIPSEELWQVHNDYRERTILFARTYIQKHQQSRLTAQDIAKINEYLDPNAFTIGFARRFATYKRAGLLFSDMPRLKALLLNPDRPVQIIIAGKAHPHDTAGKEIIQTIIHNVREHGLDRRVVFLEDYSMAVSRAMLKGCDIWLNTPRRPQEASGTSGMKAGLNGCLHVSILDGWWDEAYNGENGFSIGYGEDFRSASDQDIVEGAALYELLEQTIIPMFYNRKGGVPYSWVQRMKAAIATIGGQFSTMRMVKDYATQFYLPAIRRADMLTADGSNNAAILKNWRQKIASAWGQVSVERVTVEGDRHASVGKTISVTAVIRCGMLHPSDLLVQTFHGGVDVVGNLTSGTAVEMTYSYDEGGKAVYRGSYVCERGGIQGCTVRVLPYHELLVSPTDIGLCVWA